MDQAIPRVLHLIWLGSPPPGFVAEAVELWRAALAVGWRVVLWDDTRTAAAGHGQLLDECPHPVVASNMLRAWLLYAYGGVYLDADVLPLGRPLDDRVGSDPGGRPRPPWVVREVEEHFSVCNAVLGFPARHLLPGRVWAYSEQALRRPELWRLPPSDLPWGGIAGPLVWARLVLDTDDVQILPPESFFPVPWSGRDDIHARDPKWLREARGRHPRSFGMHEWRRSWETA